MFAKINIIISFIIILSGLYYLSDSNISYSNKIKQFKCNQWILLKSNVYLKRGALFYLVHKKLIRLFFLSKSSIFLNDLTGSLLVKTNDITKEQSIQLHNYSITNHDRKFGYEINSIDIIFSIQNLTSLRIQIKNYEEILKIKIKDIRKTNKNYSLICTKPMELKNKDYKQIKFWLEFNRMIGFNKIVIHNNSIDHNYIDLFKEYKNYIQIYKSMPIYETNLFSKLNNGHKWLIESLFISECYFNNIDSYENIFVIDQDELLIPRKYKTIYPINFKQKFNQSLTIDYSIQKTDINNYIDLIKETYKLPSKISLHFKMGFYLKDNLIKLIFNKFKECLLINNNRFKNESIEIIIKDKDKINNNPFNYIFTISTFEQYEYLNYLVNQYETIYEPYFKMNSDFIQKYMPEIYSRFYFISGTFVDYFSGKTFHNTQKVSSYIFIHYASNNQESFEINRTFAHLSHFRNSYVFENYNDKISIDQLYFDYNYFYIYFEKIKSNFNS